jgi:hypothetical protein
MHVVWPVLGVVIVLVGLVDVFFAVLQHDAVGFLTPSLYRWSWAVARRATSPFPAPLRAVLRSLVAPAMVVLTLGVWLGTQALGFALIYYPGMLGHGFVLGHDLRRSFGVALYFSAATLSSLSFGDLNPGSMTFHALAAVETLIGLGILTLTISYLLSVYRVLQEQNALAAALHHQAEDGGDPRSILAPHFVDGKEVGLSTHLREFHRSLVDQGEGLRRYPIVYYFQSRRAYRSIPYVFHMIGGVVSALRFGLPEGHPASRDPWLPSLATGYRDVMREVERMFVPNVGWTTPEPAPFERFRAVFCGPVGDPEPGDARVGEFYALDRFMRGLAAIDAPADPEEAYGRYRRWLPFAAESAEFVAAMAADLGTDLGDLEAEPEPAND